MKFFNRVKEIREDLSTQRENRNEPPFTQEDLAMAVGCSRVMISKIERGISEPGIALGMRISRALGVDPFELFRIEPIENPLVQSKIGELKPLAPELIEIADLFGHEMPVNRS